MFNVRTVIYFRMDFILVLLPVSDVYISTSNDPDPRTQCGCEVNIMFLISNFCRVVNVVCFLLGDSPTSVV
jgi:hypothetical protein